MAQFRKLIREHLPFVVVAPLLIVVMTWPTIAHAFDPKTFWLPTLDADIWLKIWDAWHFKQVLAGESDFYFTNMLFYPHGISLAYLTYSLPHLTVLNALQLFMTPANAYCMTFLLNSYFCALAAYIYCHYVFKDKWLALLGAVIFGCSQQVLGRPMEPDTTVIATLPLTLYFLHRGLDEGRMKLLAMAGFTLGFTAYCGMYILVCTALTAAVFVLCYTASKWRERQLWAGLALLGMVALIVSAGRVLPIVSDSGALGRAIERQLEPLESDEGRDVTGFVVSQRHPLLTPLFGAIAGLELNELAPHRRVYIHGQLLRATVGIMTLLLAGFGLLRKSSRRRMLPWLLIAAAFMILRLGPVLQVNGEVYRDILLPKHYLDQLLPIFFASFYNPDHFQIGALLPLAVMAGYGLRAALTSIAMNRRAPIVLLVAAAVAFEIYYMPYGRTVDLDRFKYIDWLAAQEDQESIRLTPLPIQIYDYGTRPVQMLQQTMHGYPISGGYIARITDETYRYIDGNALLSASRHEAGVVCSGPRRDEMSDALAQLEADGFSHIVLHKREAGAAPMLASFAVMTPAYEDWHALVYEIGQMRRECESPPPGTDSLALYLELVYGNVIAPRDEAVLTFHPDDRINDEALRYLSWNADFGGNLSHVTVDGAGQLSLQSTNPGMQSIDDIAAQDALIFLQNPADMAQRDAAWRDWFSARFQLCQRLAESERIVIDHYLSRDLPCELVAAADKLALLYDNGSRLLNRTLEIDDEALRLHLWWRIADGPKASYSIQIFDASGEKVRQSDSVMNRELRSHAFDLSGLEAGEYGLRLIVYDFESGASHSGEVMADSTRFNREIEIARFTLDA